MAGPRTPTELLDLALMESIVRAVEKISKSIEKLTEDIQGAGTTTTEVAKEAEEATERQNQALQELAERWEEQEEGIKKVTKSWTGFDVRKQTQEFEKLGKAVKDAMGSLSGGDIKGAGQAMMNALPFGMGGFLSFMLWGAGRKQEFEAASRRALFTLQQVGGVGAQHLGQLTGQIESMYKAWGSMGQEFEATLSAFAQFNIAEGAFNKASISAKGFGDNIMSVATAMDVLNAAQPGTTAKLIGETMVNAGVGVNEAADQVFRLGKSLREAGLHYGMFSAGIVQANSALRLQNQSLDDTRRVFEHLNKQFQAQGMSKERASQMALSGVQAQAAAVGGLSGGLAGVVARELQKRGGLKGELGGIQDPVALMTQLQIGLRAKDQNVIGEVSGALKNLTMGMRGGGTNLEQTRRQEFGLSQIGGFSLEAAQAIVEGKDLTAALMDPAEKTADHISGLDEAFKTYSDRQSTFEVAMREMQGELADVAQNILTILTTSATLLPLYFDKLALKLTIGGDSKRMVQLDRDIGALSSVMLKAQDEAVGHFNTAMQAAGEAGGKLIDPKIREITERRRKEAEEAQRDVAGKAVANLDLGGLGLDEVHQQQVIDEITNNVRDELAHGERAQHLVRGELGAEERDETDAEMAARVAKEGVERHRKILRLSPNMSVRVDTTVTPVPNMSEPRTAPTLR